MSDAEPKISWIVTISDVADADMEAAYRYLMTFLPANRVEVWLEAFYDKLLSLGNFPGPESNAVDEVATARRGQEVRRVLFRGSRKHPHSFAYKAFYRVIPPAEGDAEGEIIIENIVHGAANYPGDEMTESEE